MIIVGVPEISPVDVSKFSPSGNTTGEIDHDTTAPPLLVGVAVGDIATSFVKTNEAGE